MYNLPSPHLPLHRLCTFIAIHFCLSNSSTIRIWIKSIKEGRPFLLGPRYPTMNWGLPLFHGVTRRCSLSLLTNSALVIRVQMRGGRAGSQQMSADVHNTWHGAQINFGDLPPYLTYALFSFWTYTIGPLEPNMQWRHSLLFFSFNCSCSELRYIEPKNIYI